MVYSYPIDEKRAKAEGFENTTITADIYTDSKYLGCPYCQKRNFVKCGTCQKPTCHTNGNSENTCAWCNKKMSDIQYRGKMTVLRGLVQKEHELIEKWRAKGMTDEQIRELLE